MHSSCTRLRGYFLFSDKKPFFQQPELQWLLSRGGTIILFGDYGKPQYFVYGNFLFVENPHGSFRKNCQNTYISRRLHNGHPWLFSSMVDGLGHEERSHGDRKVLEK